MFSHKMYWVAQNLLITELRVWTWVCVVFLSSTLQALGSKRKQTVIVSQLNSKIVNADLASVLSMFQTEAVLYVYLLHYNSGPYGQTNTHFISFRFKILTVPVFQTGGRMIMRLCCMFVSYYTRLGQLEQTNTLYFSSIQNCKCWSSNF